MSNNTYKLLLNLFLDEIFLIFEEETAECIFF